MALSYAPAVLLAGNPIPAPPAAAAAIALLALLLAGPMLLRQAALRFGLCGGGPACSGRGLAGVAIAVFVAFVAAALALLLHLAAGACS